MGQILDSDDMQFHMLIAGGTGSGRTNPVLYTAKKAVGGIRTLDAAIEMVRARADRIGTSSGAGIMAERAEQANL